MQYTVCWYKCGYGLQTDNLWYMTWMCSHHSKENSPYWILHSPVWGMRLAQADLNVECPDSTTPGPSVVYIVECTHAGTLATAPLPGIEPRCELGPRRVIIRLSINQLTNSSKARFILMLSLFSAFTVQDSCRVVWWLDFTYFICHPWRLHWKNHRFACLQLAINHQVYSWNGAHSHTVRQQLVALIHWDSSRAITGSAS